MFLSVYTVILLLLLVPRCLASQHLVFEKTKMKMSVLKNILLAALASSANAAKTYPDPDGFLWGVATAVRSVSNFNYHQSLEVNNSTLNALNSLGIPKRRSSRCWRPQAIHLGHFRSWQKPDWRQLYAQSRKRCVVSRASTK